MSNKKIDFYQLGNKLWNIANIFRDDTLKTTEYLEEFSYFLFLKLFDEQERQKEELAKLEERSFIPSLPEELRFHFWAEKIINNEIDVTEAVKTVQDVFQNLAEIGDHDGKDLSLFRKLFKNHIWRIKYGPTIRDLLKKLIDLDLEQNFDVMGRAYEFVVQKLGEQKQYGQYFTPRHIIHFMVELADPDISEMIYDPAAGTGGFILRAFEIVKDKINRQAERGFQGIKEPIVSYRDAAYDKGEKMIRDFKNRHLWAVEKAPDVFKLSMMNMILHNDGKSNLYEADSLDNRAQSEHRGKYDVVLSNPPYGPLTQSRTATFTYHVKRFEALFFQHIMNALKFSESSAKRSRAVVIILDKILFDNTNAFKNIRKKLLREYNLKAVFSMPAGIFQPYSGVKTTVMYFERPTKDEWKRIKDENGFATRKVMFFDVQSDGFTLATQRRPINGAFQGDNPNIYEPPCGDLPKAVETFKKWNEWLQNPADELPDFVDNKQVWIADIEEIKEKDFNLNPGLYRKVERGKVKWEWVKLGQIIKGKPQYGANTPALEYFENIRYVRITDIDDNGFLKDEKVSPKEVSEKYILEDGDLLLARSGSVGRSFLYKSDKYKNEKMLFAGYFIRFKIDAAKALPDYIFYLTKSAYFNNWIESIKRSSSQSNINAVEYQEFSFPLPPLEIQQQIVERLNKQQAIIEKAKEMEKAIIESGIDDAIFDGDWEWTELGEVAELIRGPFGGSLKKEIFVDSGYAVYEQSHAITGDFSKVKYFITKDKFNEMKRFEVKPNDLIMSCSGTIGKTAIVPNNIMPGIINQALLKITPSQMLIARFLKYYLESFFQNQEEKLIYGSGIKNVTSVNVLKSLQIPLPPLEKQQEIVEFLDTQFKTLEHIRKLKENTQEAIKIILGKEVFTNG